MADDKKQVIYDLERCTCHVPDACRDCSKHRHWSGNAVTCMESLMEDALDLLKEQEPALPTWSQGKAYCGNCGQRLPRKSVDREINYCGYCGKAVKWE